MALLKYFFAIVMLLFVTLVLVVLFGKVHLTRSEAEAIAQRELTKYCYREGLSEKDFSKFKVFSQEGSFVGYLLGQCNSCWEYPWIFEAYSPSCPHHEFSVSINAYGTASVHYMAEP